MKIWKLIISLTHSRTLSLLAFLVILLAIPLTVFIAQQQQEIRQRAEGSCPDQCYSTELWVGIPRLADGTCDNLHPQSVFTCPGEENTVTCGGQPYYCDGYWKPGVRPQPTQPPPAPTNPPAPQPTATPQPTSVSLCGINCASVTGDSISNCTGNTFLSVTDLGNGRCWASCISCGDKVGNPRDRCNCADRPTATPRPTQPAGGGGGGGPTATPTPTPRSGGPTATPTPRSGGPTATPTPIGSGPTPTGTRIAGDIDGDGYVNIQDYSILVSCYGTKVNKPSCGTNKTKVDLNNDGKVDGIDYNILLRTFWEIKIY